MTQELYGLLRLLLQSLTTAGFFATLYLALDTLFYVRKVWNSKRKETHSK